MADLSVCLFGRLEIRNGNQLVDKLTAIRVQELFVYLLLFRDRSHTREVLAELLWPNAAGKQGMKYLRHTLWQLQDGLGHNFLVLNGQWVSIKPEMEIWLDVARFNEIVSELRDISGIKFNEKCAEQAKKALSLYKGALFEGCYKDWCIVERERYQHLLLHLLDKLIAYCEVKGLYATGLEYGALALQFDMAHERIHRRLMRLHIQGGNRAAAIRQFELCNAFLKKELDAQPSGRTIKLYDQIRQSGDLISIEEVQPMVLREKKRSRVVHTLLTIQSTLHHMQTQLEDVLNLISQESQGDS